MWIQLMNSAQKQFWIRFLHQFYSRKSSIYATTQIPWWCLIHRSIQNMLNTSCDCFIRKCLTSSQSEMKWNYKNQIAIMRTKQTPSPFQDLGREGRLNIVTNPGKLIFLEWLTWQFLSAFTGVSLELHNTEKRVRSRGDMRSSRNAAFTNCILLYVELER